MHRFDVSSTTFRRWADEGKVRALRFDGGKRVYKVADVLQRLGHEEPGREGRERIIYARVSSSKQRADLQRQMDDVQKAFPGHRVISDVGSGVVNFFKRKGLCALLERAVQGMVEEVVVAHRDRLARLGFDLLEFVFAKVGTKLVVHRPNEEAEEAAGGGGSDRERDLADDLLAVTTLFVASHHGRRAAEENRKRRATERAAASGQEAEDAGGKTRERPKAKEEGVHEPSPGTEDPSVPEQ